MKILLVTQAYKDSFPPRNLSMGSAVKQAEQLSKSHFVHVLTVGRQVRFDKINRNLLVESVSGLLLPDPVNYIVSLPLLIRFIQLAAKDRPNIVLVSKFMFFSSLVVVPARIMGLKVITVTDTFPGINWFPRSWLVSIVMWLYARSIGLIILLLSHRVVLLYRGLETVARRLPVKYQIIPNGVEPQLLHKLPPPRDIKKPIGDFWVGFVGRAESVKGYDIALKAADLMASDKKVKFVFIGGNQKEQTNTNKLFLGFRHDIYSIYQLMDCLILPSFSEGLPNVVMEAMAQGVPVIGSSVGGVEYLIEDGINGFLVSPGSADHLVEKINVLREDTALARKMGSHARKTINNDYNWNKILGQYKVLFEKVCAE
jgi:glycosyltransferase involved in cell wall biosynthesis